MLQGYRVLIVEDEYLLAEELRHELTEAGAIVTGMASTVKDALALIDGGGELDGAILDVNIGGKPVFAVADRLMDLGVPFVFTTGYDESAIPPRFKHALIFEKPLDVAGVLRSVRQVV